MVDRARSNYENFKNHTAILFWSLGNESFAGDNLAAMNKFYKEHDDSRLIHYEGVCHTHNYSQQIPSLDQKSYLPAGGLRTTVTRSPTWRAGCTCHQSRWRNT